MKNTKLKLHLRQFIIFLSFLLLYLITIPPNLNTAFASEKTNADATLYKTKYHFDKSNAYLNFTDFHNYLDYGKSIIIPGMLNTDVEGTKCTTMCPQGVCLAKDFVLVTAYDTNNECNSVIYVISNKTKKLRTTIVLPMKAHVGGVAYDGTNIWVSNDGNKVSCFKYSLLRKALKKSSYKVSFTHTYTLDLDKSASFMTYYNKQLWVGSFIENGDGKVSHMYSFNIKDKYKTPTLTKCYTIKIPNRVQGATFLNKETLVLSRAQNVNQSTSEDYISELHFYHLTWNKKKKVITGKKNGTFSLPPQNEGIYTYDGRLYVLFESAAYKYRIGQPYLCQNPVDRICAFSISNLKKNFIHSVE